jgi:hypothetical protein
MKTSLIKYAFILPLIGTPSVAGAAPWVACGQISNIAVGTCQIASRPPTQYEYGIAYNTREPVPVVCTFWNVGARIANKEPYLVFSDDPLSGMRWGGFVFYQGTNASDDNACIGGYRHQYWTLGANNTITVGNSNGCFTTQAVYCRLR